MSEPLLIARTPDTELFLLPGMANRHGLITGATGTGKTVTLQKLAESLSEIGVPVFMADVKGDLTGIAQAGTASEKLLARLKNISGLHNYVKYLKSSGQDAGRYQLNMWSKIFQPLSVAVMMLMALSFIFGPLRSVPMGVRVVTGISFGFVFYVLDQIFGPLTLVYGIPPIIGALLPSASFFLISLWLLMRKS
jgi:lipopolysaccharide export LptBFGC system permease protein LptF